MLQEQGVVGDACLPVAAVYLRGSAGRATAALREPRVWTALQRPSRRSRRGRSWSPTTAHRRRCAPSS